MQKEGLRLNQQAQIAVQTKQLLQHNALSRRFGLTLTESQARALIAAERQALQDTGRLEFGKGILPRLIDKFCDSPLIGRDDYAKTLSSLQQMFYAFHNDLNDMLSDDELLLAMHSLFHVKAKGSLSYLEMMDVADLVRVIYRNEEEGGTEDV